MEDLGVFDAVAAVGIAEVCGYIWEDGVEGLEDVAIC
jgi:hypothetical protein